MNICLAAMPLVADSDWGHMGDWGAGWWIVMMLGMVLFWGLVIGGVVWVVHELTRRRDGSPQEPTPLGLLDRRLASGDIGIEEYKQRRSLLGNGSRT
jgi:putative membrane protein